LASLSLPFSGFWCALFSRAGMFISFFFFSQQAAPRIVRLPASSLGSAFRSRGRFHILFQLLSYLSSRRISSRSPSMCSANTHPFFSFAPLRMSISTWTVLQRPVLPRIGLFDSCRILMRGSVKGHLGGLLEGTSVCCLPSVVGPAFFLRRPQGVKILPTLLRPTR